MCMCMCRYISRLFFSFFSCFRFASSTTREHFNSLLPPNPVIRRGLGNGINPSPRHWRLLLRRFGLIAIVSRVAPRRRGWLAAVVIRRGAAWWAVGRISVVARRRPGRWGWLAVTVMRRRLAVSVVRWRGLVVATPVMLRRGSVVATTVGRVLPVAERGWRDGRVAGGRSVVPPGHGIHVPRADLGPQRVLELAVAELAQRCQRVTVVVAVATAAGLGMLGLIEDVVLSLLDGVGGKGAVQLMALWVLVRPLLHGLEHGPLDLDIFVAQGGVVEGSQNIVHDFINRDVGVFPCVENTPVILLAFAFSCCFPPKR